MNGIERPLKQRGCKKIHKKCRDVVSFGSDVKRYALKTVMSKFFGEKNLIKIFKDFNDQKKIGLT